MKQVKNLYAISLFKSIEDKFESLSLRLKIEIFLFPLILLLLISYQFYDNKNNSNKVIKIKTDITNIKMKDSYIAILKQIEKFSADNNININFIKRVDNNVVLKLSSNLKNLFIFLDFIERFNNFSKIEALDLIGNRLDLEISFKKFYQKNLFSKPTIKSIKKSEEKEFILKAIIDDEVLINDKWIKKDQFLSGYKLIKILNDKVCLENKNEKITLKLYKNEKF